MWALLLCAAAVVESVPAVQTATGCPSRMPESEEFRAEEFLRIHKEWPLSRRYPGGMLTSDGEGWLTYLRRKEVAINATIDSTLRWEKWLEQVQIAALVNWTVTGWGLGWMPTDLHQDVLTHFRKEHKHCFPKTTNRCHSEEVIRGGYVTGKRSIIEIDQFRDRIVAAAQRLVAEWAGVAPETLEHTVTYGIRAYYRNSTLSTHVDAVETHVLSVIYVVDYEYDSDLPGSTAEPWYVVTDPDLTGNRQAQEVKPGQLFFYESAKLPHGRPSQLKGAFSAHIFIHFRPVGWSFQNLDRVYGVPPHWVLHSSQETSQETSRGVSFRNALRDGVSLFWVPERRSDAVAASPGGWRKGEVLRQSTFTGHVYEAREGDAVLERWTIGKGDEGREFVLRDREL